MAEVKWIKIVTDIFDDEKILLIENMPESDSIIVIWFKLLCLAGKQNNSGVIIMPNGVPYNDELLASVFRRKKSVVTMALQTFEKFGMIEIINDAVTIPNWGKHQNIDSIDNIKEKNRVRQQRYRDKQKMLANNNILHLNGYVETISSEHSVTHNVTRNVTSNVTSNAKDNVTITQRNACVTHIDKEEDIDIELDKDREYEDNEEDEGSVAVVDRPDLMFRTVIEHYENVFGDFPAPMVVENVKDYLEHMEPQVIIRAMDIAISERNRKWSYVKGILRNYKNNGIKTLSEALQEQEDFERAKEEKRNAANNRGNTTASNPITFTGFKSAFDD